MMAFRKLCALVLISAVPVAATVVAARQVVLQHLNDLSIWEGGGMGMFAEIGGFARVVMVQVVDRNGTLHPVVEMTPHQLRLADSARKHPRPENFERLAEALRGADWVAYGPPAPRPVHDETGAMIGLRDVRQYRLQPHVPGPNHATPDVVLKAGRDGTSLLIEFWKIRYDPLTRVATRRLAHRVAVP